MSTNPADMTAEEYREFFFNDFLPATQEREAIQGEPATTDDADMALAAVTHKPTQDNVALLFEKRFGDSLRYCKDWGKWLRWDGSCWKEDHTDLAFDHIRAIVRMVNFKQDEKMARVTFASGVERFSRASRVFATEVEQWNRNDELLNTPRGTVEL